MTETADLTKADLAARAEELGVDVPAKAKKDELVALVEDAEAKAAEETPADEPDAPAEDPPPAEPEPEPEPAAPETVTKTGHERPVEKVRDGVWWCPYCDHSQRVGDFDTCQGCGARRGS